MSTRSIGIPERPLTVADYRKIGEVEPGYTELDEGRLILAASPAPDHGSATFELGVQLRSQLPPELEIILDLDVDRRAPLPIADLLAFADVPFVYLTTGVLGPVPSRHRQRPVVEKPFTREVLLAAVEKAMAKQRQVANDNRWLGGVVPWPRVYPPL